MSDTNLTQLAEELKQKTREAEIEVQKMETELAKKREEKRKLDIEIPALEREIANKNAEIRRVGR